MSKVRAWAKAQKNSNQEKRPIKILSNAIIYGLSNFCNPEKSSMKKEREEDSLNRARKSVLTKYSGDTSLFEIGCYLYFRIDLWHYRNKVQKHREKIVNYLIAQFLLVFNYLLSGYIENDEEILQNRLDLYSRLVRESKNREELQNRITFYLTQLIIRTKNNTRPKVYNFTEGFPLVILDVFEEIYLRLEITSFEIGMIPSCLETIDNFYKLTSL